MRDLEESIYFKLWGSENVVPRDLRLNTIHDDALLAAAGTIAKQGERIKNKFLIKEENSSGIYAVQLFLLGDAVSMRRPASLWKKTVGPIDGRRRSRLGHPLPTKLASSVPRSSLNLDP